MNPKQRQQWIYDELVKAPALSYGEMFTGYLQVFTNLSRQTFTKDWNKATERLQSYQKEVNKAKLEESIKIEKEAVRRKILTKLEAMEILTEIAEGKAKKIDGKIIIPSFTDRSRAIETLGKFDGWNAPTETKLTLDKTEPIQIEFFDNEDI